MKNNKNIIIIVVLVVILIGAVFGILTLTKDKKESGNTPSNSNKVEKPATSDVIKLGEETYIKQLEKVKIENTEDYVMITKKVKLYVPEHEEGVHVSSAQIIEYKFIVDGVEYDGEFQLGDVPPKASDTNPKYNFKVTNLTVDYDIRILVTAK